MKRHVYASALALALLAASEARAQTLTVRLVSARSDDKGDNAQLEDVLDMLKDYLPYRSYSLVASEAAELPAEKSVLRLSRYTVTCSGGRDNLAIRVQSDGRELLNTTVKLRVGAPFVLGGFGGERGKMALVFVLK